MAWPNNLKEVHCYRFDRKHLPTIKAAITDKKVVWGRSSMFSGASSSEFSWADRQWTLEESFETVTCVGLSAEYIPMTDEDFTVAVLAGR